MLSVYDFKGAGRSGAHKRPKANRSALALDRPAACTSRLVSNAGGHRQQARANPLGDPRQRRALRSLLYPNPSVVTRKPHHDPKTQGHRPTLKGLHATHPMRGAALRMESCCAVTIRARAQKRQCPNKAFIGVQSAPPPIYHRVRHNIGISQ